MPLIPLKQTVKVTRRSGFDEWGESAGESTVIMKCRVDEIEQVVTNQLGEEAQSSMQLIFNKLADIQYEDEIEYTNELGHVFRREPIKIEPIRMINGKPTLTFVYT